MTQDKILIVDDEKAILLLFEKAFSRAGYLVRTATSGKAALSLLQNEEIHVVFSDLNLPEMDGLELCREIKKHMPITIIYAMTGYASLFQLVDCRDAGFDDYFKKPVNLEVLLKAAKDAFEKIKRWKKGQIK
ncbi:MAG: response regulator [Deltaproteobacteria bacterium]|nr:response regulator [Deltaproteobacteria bacterium]